MPGREAAVGVRFQPSDPAPQILFRARGWQARRVVELATERGIPLVDEPLLASVLVQLPEGSWIPEEHFAVLAQILARVYLYDKDRHR